MDLDELLKLREKYPNSLNFRHAQSWQFFLDRQAKEQKRPPQEEIIKFILDKPKSERGAYILSYGIAQFIKAGQIDTIITSINQEKDTEIKRLFIEQLGWPELVKQLGIENTLKLINQASSIAMRQWMLEQHGWDNYLKDAGLADVIYHIYNERNVEMRRWLIEKHGWQRFMLDARAEEIHEDEFGTLYRLDLSDDHPLLMVKVVNATAEADGTYKDYYLMVDSQLRPMYQDAYGQMSFGKPQELTARNAVASTFGKYGHQYAPEIES
jgi:hypothetical protein